MMGRFRVALLVSCICLAYARQRYPSPFSSSLSKRPLWSRQSFSPSAFSSDSDQANQGFSSMDRGYTSSFTPSYTSVNTPRKMPDLDSWSSQDQTSQDSNGAFLNNPAVSYTSSPFSLQKKSQASWAQDSDRAFQNNPAALYSSSPFSMQKKSQASWAQDSDRAFQNNPAASYGSSPFSMQKKSQASWAQDSDRAFQNNPAASYGSSPFSLQRNSQSSWAQDSDRAFQNNPETPWEAPSYSKLLKAIDDGEAALRAHFTNDAEDGIDTKNLQYIILIHAVHSLSTEVGENGWESYNLHYSKLVRKYAEEGFNDPRRVVRLLECRVFEPVAKILQEIRQVVNNPAVKYVCKVRPSSCDAAIWIILHYKNYISVSERVLVAVGKAATTFLQSYDQIFEGVSSESLVYKYLNSAKEELHPLIEVNAAAHRALPPFNWQECISYDSPRKTYNYDVGSNLT